MNRVTPKLRGERLLGEPGAREDDEAARLLVEPVDDAERRALAARRRASPLEPGAHARVERIDLRTVVRDGAEARRLRDHHDLRVGVYDIAVGQLLRARLSGRLVDGNLGAGDDACGRVRHERATDAHLAALDPPAALPQLVPKRPRRARSTGPSRAVGTSLVRAFRVILAPAVACGRSGGEAPTAADCCGLRRIAADARTAALRSENPKVDPLLDSES